MEYRVNNLFYAGGKDLLNTIRLGIEMKYPVNADALRKAADMAITRFPYFSVKLVRRGEEYVMIHNDAPLTITPGGRAIPLGGTESAGHLLALAYDGHRIYIDTSHFITDGNGSFPFVKTLLYCYLQLLFPDEEFDLNGIALPGSDMLPGESDDYPFPDEPVPVEPLGSDKRPDEVFMPFGQQTGYAGRDNWTSFRIRVKQKDMMKYASSVDGSPATFIASTMYRAISDLHPEMELPIVCGMQHQYRKALGKPFSHMCHVNIVPITYPARMRGRPVETINTMARGIVIIRADDENDRKSINAHIMNEKRIKTLTLAEKRDYMKAFFLHSIGNNTFDTSYTGRVDFSGLDRYISDFFPFIDITLSGGISIEIFSFGEDFCINIMQQNNDSRYIDRFVEIFMESGIRCVYEAPEHFGISDLVLPE